MRELRTHHIASPKIPLQLAIRRVELRDRLEILLRLREQPLAGHLASVAPRKQRAGDVVLLEPWRTEIHFQVVFDLVAIAENAFTVSIRPSSDLDRSARVGNEAKKEIDDFILHLHLLRRAALDTIASEWPRGRR